MRLRSNCLQIAAYLPIANASMLPKGLDRNVDVVALGATVVGAFVLRSDVVGAARARDKRLAAVDTGVRLCAVEHGPVELPRAPADPPPAYRALGEGEVLVVVVEAYRGRGKPPGADDALVLTVRQ